ncbi:MAG: ABC transporter ATP-binding protein [Candidatus Firestonebacteria bacterium]|nr:ABC transporter ATP-binding protein [Candidatus Firestonebacteria bacterium]
MSHHIIEANNLHFVYPDGTKAINGISLKIMHGESVGIVGPNGAGKSTLIMQMNGFFMPTSGSLNIGGIPVSEKTKAEIRRHVGLVFQNPDDQLFMPTVFDDVAFGPLNLDLSKEAVEKCVNEALIEVGCLELKDRPSHHLSLGQKRAVSIAAVLSMGPDILVMDEPSSFLDPRSRRDIINLLKKFKHSKIVVSHDLDLILDVCERCLILKDGKIQADAPTKELLMQKNILEQNHLELPLTLQKR